ncbi:MAG: peptidylprolyl isomerase [Pseudobdellovibrio sp.]
MLKAYHVFHILVKHNYEADDLIKKLADSISFEELAQKFSICSSAKNNGDLGLIPLGKADAEFEEAALQLKPGHVTKKPIRTRFGFHLIKRIS